jgi:hypothetical protein
MVAPLDGRGGQGIVVVQSARAAEPDLDAEADALDRLVAAGQVPGHDEVGWLARP